MKKLFLISALLLFASNGWAETYVCDFEGLDERMNVSFEKNESSYLVQIPYGKEKDGDLIESVKPGSVTFIKPDGNLKTFKLTVTRESYPEVRAFFIDNLNGGIHTLNINNCDNCLSYYTKPQMNRLNMNESIIKTYKGNCLRN